MPSEGPHGGPSAAWDKIDPGNATASTASSKHYMVSWAGHDAAMNMAMSGAGMADKCPDVDGGPGRNPPTLRQYPASALRESGFSNSTSGTAVRALGWRASAPPPRTSSARAAAAAAPWSSRLRSAHSKHKRSYANPPGAYGACPTHADVFCTCNQPRLREDSG